MLAAFDAGAEVVPLDAARERRIKRWGTALSAAAAVAILGAVVGTLVTRGPSKDVVRTADVAVSSAKSTGDEPVVAAEVASAEVTAAGAPETAAPSTSAAGDSMTPATAAEQSPAARQAELVIVSSTEQLPPLVDALIAEVNAGTRALPQHPCTTITGTAIAPILINHTEALLVVRPSTDSPTEIIVVALPSCRVDTTLSI
ncbi:MAG: hypothetical protein ACKOD2_10325 [Ilumatobacteraceae bacterium]